jgi:hypothetical protein
VKVEVGQALLKTLRGDRSKGEASLKLSKKTLTIDPLMKRFQTLSEVKTKVVAAQNMRQYLDL